MGWGRSERIFPQLQLFRERFLRGFDPAERRPFLPRFEYKRVRSAGHDGVRVRGKGNQFRRNRSGRGFGELIHGDRGRF